MTARRSPAPLVVLRGSALFSLMLTGALAGCASEGATSSDNALADGPGVGSEPETTPEPAAPTEPDVGAPNVGAPNVEEPEDVPEAVQPEPASEVGGDIDNGQTGSPGAQECGQDDNCVVDAEVWGQPFGSAELVSAACDYVFPGQDVLPVCACTLRITPFDGGSDAGVATSVSPPFDSVEYAGHRGLPSLDGCSVFGRTPECSYCASEFPGCQLGDDAACQEPCEQVARVKNEEYQASYEFSQRVARCDEGGGCERIVELDGKCYANVPSVATPALDCALSDEELLSHRDDFSAGTCDSPGPLACETALDCPSGLACNAGRCGRCSDMCSYPTGAPEEAVCDGDAACASGELCSNGFCVLEENVECRFREQCEGGACVLSGMDNVNGRGNVETRSFCLN